VLNLVVAERKRRGKSWGMWTGDHKRSDANHIAWINLMQSNIAHCSKLWLMTAQRSYIDTSTAQVTAPGLFGGFPFRGLKTLKGGDSWIHSTVQRKEHSKLEFGKKNSENEFGESETFYLSKFSGSRPCRAWLLDLGHVGLDCCFWRDTSVRRGESTEWLPVSKLRSHFWGCIKSKY